MRVGEDLPLYPRARGAGRTIDAAVYGALPLPSRTRGRHGSQIEEIQTGPSTPAHAGPAFECEEGKGEIDLYPRARGAGISRRKIGAAGGPLPPRTRGRP